jgi:hypothetical protein
MTPSTLLSQTTGRRALISTISNTHTHIRHKFCFVTPSPRFLLQRNKREAEQRATEWTRKCSARSPLPPQLVTRRPQVRAARCAVIDKTFSCGQQHAPTSPRLCAHGFHRAAGHCKILFFNISVRF